MIKCPYCKNIKKIYLYQHNKDQIGLGTYGRHFTCKLCNKCFFLMDNEADQQEICNFNKEKSKEYYENL